MHDSDSFISEVSEAVRRDRLTRTLTRYGWLIAALILLVVGGAAFHEWRKWHDASTAADAGDAMRAALALPDAPARAAGLAEFATTHPDAAVIARLAQAGTLAGNGDTTGAATVLADLAADGATPDLYRSLAALERVMLLGATLDPSERSATIETLVTPGAPFRALALEQRALMRLETGDKAAAIEDLQAILAEPGATEALAARTRQLVIAAGGTLPGTPVSNPAGSAAAPADG